LNEYLAGTTVSMIASLLSRRPTPSSDGFRQRAVQTEPSILVGFSDLRSMFTLIPFDEDPVSDITSRGRYRENQMASI
jgi:hypothetical protein